LKKLVKQLNTAHPNLEADIARRLLITCEDSEEHVKNIAIEYDILLVIDENKASVYYIDYGLKLNYQ
jgi:hypothetical protein